MWRVILATKKKKCFRCYAENSFVVGKREKLEVGSPFRKWFLQFRNQGVPAGGGDADEGISGEDAEMQTGKRKSHHFTLASAFHLKLLCSL